MRKWEKALTDKYFVDMFEGEDFRADFEKIVADTEAGAYIPGDKAYHDDRTALDVVRELEASGEPIVNFNYPGGFLQFKKDAESGKI